MVNLARTANCLLLPVVQFINDGPAVAYMEKFIFFCILFLFN